MSYIAAPVAGWGLLEGMPLAPIIVLVLVVSGCGKAAPQVPSPTPPSRMPGGSTTWIISGQSNAAGYAIGTPRPIDPRVTAWSLSTQAWKPAQDPLPFVILDPVLPERNRRVGAWHVAALAALPRWSEVRLTGYAVAGNAIDWWAEGAGGWSMLSTAIDQSGRGASAFIWYQGETDASVSMSAAGYAARLADLVRRVRERAGVPLLVVVCG